MATVEVDYEVLRALFLPGLNVQIDRISLASDQSRDSLLLELSGPDVPTNCERAILTMIRHYDEAGPAITLTAVLKPAD